MLSIALEDVGAVLLNEGSNLCASSLVRIYSSTRYKIVVVHMRIRYVVHCEDPLMLSFLLKLKL